MNLGNKLLENLECNIEDIQIALEVLAPSVAERHIENSRGEKVFFVSMNYIQYVYSFGKYNIIIDYNNDIFIDTNIKVVEATSIMEFL